MKQIETRVVVYSLGLTAVCLDMMIVTVAVSSAVSSKSNGAQTDLLQRVLAQASSCNLSGTWLRPKCDTNVTMLAGT